jgi:hypothetical protein
MEINMKKTYKGKFKEFKNPEKYIGDLDNVTYRSLWERNVMRWLDENPNVKEWASEELFFPYNHPITGKRAKYYPDFYVKMIDGVNRVIEVKPQKEIDKPVSPTRKTKSYMEAVSTWIVNQEKWKTAEFYCNKNNINFEIWSENTLTEMGIMKSFQGSKGKLLAERKGAKPANKPTRPRPKRRS